MPLLNKCFSVMDPLTIYVSVPYFAVAEWLIPSVRSLELVYSHKYHTSHHLNFLMDRGLLLASILSVIKFSVRFLAQVQALENHGILPEGQQPQSECFIT